MTVEYIPQAQRSSKRSHSWKTWYNKIMSEPEDDDRSSSSSEEEDEDAKVRFFFSPLDRNDMFNMVLFFHVPLNMPQLTVEVGEGNRVP